VILRFVFFSAMLRVIYHKIISSHLTDSECWCVVSRYYNPTVRTERKLVQFVLLEVVVEARQESGDNIIDNLSTKGILHFSPHYIYS
jgi:hypothetical protein